MLQFFRNAVNFWSGLFSLRPGQSLKTKIFYTILVAVLVVSGIIALLARWILVSSLTAELQHRGLAIAQSVAERASGFILDQDTPGLVTLVFDTAQLGDRKDLITYVFVTDADGGILAHTFTRPFPGVLRGTNNLGEGQQHSVRLVSSVGKPAYDIAVPVSEGIYRIGTVHVGLAKHHIDALVAKLRFTFLGFISLVIVIIFGISLRLSSTITRPIRQLTEVADELARGNFDLTPTALGPWNLDCPAMRNTELPCWHFDQPGAGQARPHVCDQCGFYPPVGDRGQDEVAQLADSFRTMVWSIKLYRRRLRESEEKYRSLFDSGPDPVFVVDQNSLRILDANPRAQELYGYDREDLLDSPFVRLDPDFPQACLDVVFADAGAPGGTEETDSTGCVYCTKIIHYTKAGTPFFVNMHACPISYMGVPAVILAATDVTEMIEKDAQLIQASKMKTLGEMSAGVAHELNQPLNAIKMGSDFLTMSATGGAKLEPDALAQLTRQISAQVDRASEIINTLRAFGRKAGLVREKLDVNRSIRGVLNLVEQQLALSDITVDLDLQEDLPAVLAHDNRLQQVLFNLVSNAKDAVLQHTLRQGGPARISIRTGLNNGQVEVAVGDNGVGISPEDLDKVFEPFYTTKETGQGMGLGLSISYGIVKDYGGEITISSAPGQGTTFTLSFPVAERT